MSKLFLLRHAKATAALPGMRDFDRPLDERGIRDAKAVGARMESKGLMPTRILCSASCRTRQTLDHVLAAFPMKAETVFSEHVYSADALQYLRLIQMHGDTEALLVIGHNPSTEELAALLADRSNKHALELVLAGFPTAALAVFGFDGSLSAIEPGRGALKDFIRSKDL
jgi:phosphohistidine phosphatase